jgi:hypothetical protein
VAKGYRRFNGRKFDPLFQTLRFELLGQERIELGDQPIAGRSLPPAQGVLSALVNCRPERRLASLAGLSYRNLPQRLFNQGAHQCM